MPRDLAAFESSIVLSDPLSRIVVEDCKRVQGPSLPSHDNCRLFLGSAGLKCSLLLSGCQSLDTMTHSGARFALFL